MAEELVKEIDNDESPSAQELLLKAQADAFDEPSEDVEEEIQIEEPSEEELAIRDEASKMGWVAKDEYDGDPKRWVDAGEFIRRQELFDKIHSQSKELTRMRKQMEAVTKKVKDWSESQYLTELARLRAQRDAAMDNEDRAGADKANEDIAKLQVAHETVKDDEEDDSIDEDRQAHAQSVANDWIKENEWFNKDPELRDMADAFAASFSNNPKNQDASVEDLFAFVDKKMKKFVKDWGKEEDPVVEDEPERPVKMSKVAQPRKAARPAQQAAPKYTRKDLDPTQLSVLVNFILPNNIMSEQDYINDLVQSGDIAAK